MKIVNSRANRVKFGTLKVGDLFKSREEVFMKINKTTVKLTDDNDSWEAIHNVINLNKGETDNFWDSETVEFLNSAALFLYGEE